MAAATTYSSLFDSNGNPVAGRPFGGAETGPQIDRVTHTVATTEIDDIGDRIVCIPLPQYARPRVLWFETADMDTNATETLDVDFVLSNGLAADDVILYNGGTAFEDAVAWAEYDPLSAVALARPSSGTYRGWHSLDFYVNAVAATAAAVAFTVQILWANK